MGYRYPSLPVVGVGALVYRNGKVLLVRRANEPGAGLWSLPGGVVKLGEPLLRAAIRELEEETGVKGRPLGVVNVDEAVIMDSGGRIKYNYILVTVLVEYLDGEPRPMSDAIDAGFFKVQDALSLDLTESTRGLFDKISRGEVCI
ncbi:MAG: NUDIX hydrolase, partial [Desulfurococcales archaeon]|nr:NUDIX hydrolase [Desulfurococcales archaeon]